MDELDECLLLLKQVFRRTWDHRCFEQAINELTLTRCGNVYVVRQRGRFELCGTADEIREPLGALLDRRILELQEESASGQTE